VIDEPRRRSDLQERKKLDMAVLVATLAILITLIGAAMSFYAKVESGHAQQEQATPWIVRWIQTLGHRTEDNVRRIERLEAYRMNGYSIPEQERRRTYEIQ